ncbi:MAG: hypothetical protein Q8P67_26905, partial [archaeon]|nr:hypothetical protein [archaeon]
SAIKISTGDIGLMRFPDKIILPRMTLLTGERIMCSLPSVVHESVVGPLLLTNFRVIFFSENSELASRLVPDHNTVAVPIAASSSSQLGGSGSQTVAAAARTAKITSTPTMSTQYAQNIAEKGLQLPILCIESIKRSKNTQQLEVWSREGGVLRFEVLSADRKAAIRSFCAAIFKTIPVEVPRTFAFSHHTSVPHAEDGWRMFTWAKEYCRMAVGEGEGSSWRISDVNNSYDLSRNYPRYLAVPVGITDKEIQGTFSARVEGRGPVLVWRNPHSCQTITRAAHYLDFNIKTRVFDEEKLLSAIISSSKHLGGGKTFLFVDCGSSIAPAQWRSRLRLAYASGPSLAQLTAGESSPSFGNSSPLSLAVEASPSSSGGVGADPTVFSTRDGMDPSPPLDGGEVPPFDFVLLKLDPFPSVKLAHTRLLKVLSDQQHLLSDSFIGGAVEQTGWLQLLLNLLRASSQVASSIVHDGASVMVLSEQGLDRSAQLSSLVQMMVDPYYRTIDGFCTLIEKEWLAMGHPFTTRCGHLRVRQEALEGPCFLLFLEAVILLLNFFPTRFEFTSKLVLLIALHLNSGLYGTFLCDDDRRRKELLVRMNTVSLWTRVNVNKPFFVNPFWLREGSIVFSSPLLLPMLYPHNITLWSEYYLRRWDLPHSHFEGQQHEWILAFFSKYLPTLEPPAPDESENYPPPTIPKRTP